MAQQSSSNPTNQTFLGRIGNASTQNATNNRDLYLKLFSGEMFALASKERQSQEIS